MQAIPVLWVAAARQGNEDSESQFVNLQISRNQQLGRSSSWSGNLTVQAVRHVDPVDDDSGADDNNGKWQPFASVDLEYQHQRLFGVPRLRFRSTLKLYSDDYLPLLQESDAVDEQRGQVWDNRLEYNIGRLDFLLLGRLSDIDDSMRSLIFPSAEAFRQPVLRLPYPGTPTIHPCLKESVLWPSRVSEDR
ncbi:MAG: hypothetical protein U1F68_15985 [Gammaproteobacteria bacterium]